MCGCKANARILVEARETKARAGDVEHRVAVARLGGPHFDAWRGRSRLRAALQGDLRVDLAKARRFKRCSGRSVCSRQLGEEERIARRSRLFHLQDQTG